MLTSLAYCRDPFPKRVETFGSDEASLLLQKCSNFRQLKLIHAKIIRHGLCQDQLLIRKMLYLCSSYGEINHPTLVFNQLSKPVTFTWNLMIRILASKGKAREALILYNLMISHGSLPDKFTFPFVIKACLAASTVSKGKEVYGLAVKTGYSRDIFLQNTLLDLYFKSRNVECGYRLFENMRVRNTVSWTTVVTGLLACAELDAAKKIFYQMPVRNVVSWTAMITGYVREQRTMEAFELFRMMQVDNVKPNEFTLVSLLLACRKMESLRMGRLVHDYMHKNGFKLSTFLGTALIDMYSKCGSLKDAVKVFDTMQTRSLATWNSMITSLGVHGCGEEALALFERMRRENVQPDAITFVGVLSACVQMKNHQKGFKYFTIMIEDYGIKTISQHWVCLIDLCKHANESDDIRSLLRTKSIRPDPSVVNELISLGYSDAVTVLTKGTSGLSQCQLPRSILDDG